MCKTASGKLLYSTGKYTQYPVINHKKKDIYICIRITESLCCAAEINTTLEINYTSVKFKKKNKDMDSS